MSETGRGGAAKRRTRTPRAERREQLLEIAERLVLDGGVSALTMERLADEAGIAKTVPYSHFANATAVLLAVLERHWKRLDERLGRIAEREGRPVMVFLREFSTVYLGEVAGERLLLRRLLQAARLDDAARLAIRKRQDQRVRALARSIERDLELQKGESRQLAEFILGALGALGGRDYPSARERDRVVEMFVRAARGAIVGSLSQPQLARVGVRLNDPSSKPEVDQDLARQLGRTRIGRGRR